MKARYITKRERLEMRQCNACRTKPNYYKWHIRLCRGGTKPDFVICSICGALIEVIEKGDTK